MKGVIIIFAFILWMYSFYHHFIASSKATIMIAFVGPEHSMMFATVFEGYGDLWAFGHRRRRSLKIRFEKKGTQFDFFERSNYEHMLIVNKIVHVPMMFDSDKVIDYIRDNETVATLWPKGRRPVQQNIETYLLQNIEMIEKIHI